MDKPLWVWGFFLLIVLLLLVFDLGVLNRKEHEISTKESLSLSLFYIVIAAIFGAWVWYYFGEISGEEYFTGYLIEKSLALDNIFVISLTFSFFKIPKLFQHRVLFWGIVGVLIMRAIMIGFGAIIIQKFSWVLYLFAAFLILTGIKMFFAIDKELDIGNSKLLNFFLKRFRVTKSLHENQFFIRQKDNTGKLRLWATPLFVALVFIEITDFIFAVDSVPAIFAITTDPFIVYTSNIFAILGLRALYFALDAVIYRFKYLKYALAAILIFIGGKVFVADLLGLEKFPASISLSITAGLLVAGFLYSMYKTRGEK